MTDRIIIDGLDLNARGPMIEIKPGTSWSQVVSDLGGTITAAVSQAQKEPLAHELLIEYEGGQGG